LNELYYSKTAINPCKWLLPYAHIRCNGGTLRSRFSNQALLPL
jgi:hypothetical protein